MKIKIFTILFFIILIWWFFLFNSNKDKKKNSENLVNISVVLNGDFLMSVRHIIEYWMDNWIFKKHWINIDSKNFYAKNPKTDSLVINFWLISDIFDSFYKKNDITWLAFAGKDIPWYAFSNLKKEQLNSISNVWVTPRHKSEKVAGNKKNAKFIWELQLKSFWIESSTKTDYKFTLHDSDKIKNLNNKNIDVTFIKSANNPNLKNFLQIDPMDTDYNLFRVMYIKNSQLQKNKGSVVNFMKAFRESQESIIKNKETFFELLWKDPNSPLAKSKEWYYKDLKYSLENIDFFPDSNKIEKVFKLYNKVYDKNQNIDQLESMIDKTIKF
ncbi:MAG: hypothetical protein ACD_4C00300G0005 [uncultured bacterium (gcode 4)]|uniref:Uncharacterized protein n=1 Tax=uncultured bacterium (gcode 4) TaxID=1234023 RepID=K2G8F8_9BACT|nr:MAG: hypothetical protein ACD_4C00300G0005 [uncultured bacterium (gcode 4)]